ncbi:MIF4G like-domain-containing protein [Tuber borchii]|uniref:MIF4G like-domain-containing protein n=1 Tax=Tuber borchii TaxID=42251 RepID=A0A2T6ZDU1_TUBBO|nr:MIF4G like-domain-containing protein [Tuber borchii]
MGDYYRGREEGRGGGRGGPRRPQKRRYRDDEDDDKEYRRSRPYEREDLASRLRRDTISIAESPLTKIEDTINLIANTFASNYDNEELRNTFLNTLLSLVVEQPFKIPFLAAAVLVINSQNAEAGKLILDEFGKAAQAYLTEGFLTSAKLVLRFLAGLQGMVEGHGLYTVLDGIVDQAAGYLTAGEAGLALDLVWIALITVPYILASSGSDNSLASELLKKTNSITEAKHRMQSLLSPFTGGYAPYDARAQGTHNARILQLNLEAHLGSEPSRPFHGVGCLPRPFESFLPELEGATKHPMPEITLPSDYPVDKSSIMPNVYFSVFADPNVETVPPPLELASTLFRDAIVDTIDTLDCNRLVVSRFLIEIDCYFSPNAFIKRAVPFDRVIETAGAEGSTWKPEDVAVDAIFSQLYKLSGPNHKLVYYHSILTELCKLAPAAVAPSLGRAIRFMYKNLESMDTELIYRFVDWFSHHLSNFGFTWKWAEWNENLTLPDVHPKKAFILGALEKEIRLSFATRIKGTIPDPYKELISEAKEKEQPHFKYDSEDEPFCNEAKEVLHAVADKKEDAEVDAILAKIIELAKESGVADPLFVARDAYVTSICHIGAKSLSHVLSCIERCKEKLLAIGNESPDARRQIVGSVLSYWEDQPGIGANVVDKLLNYSIVTPLSVVEWVLHDAGNKALSHTHAWEMVSTTINKVNTRVRQMIAAKQVMSINDYTEEQLAVYAQTLNAAEIEQGMLLNAVTDALTAMSDSSDEMNGGIDVESKAWMQWWAKGWLRAFSRKFGVAEGTVVEQPAAHGEPSIKLDPEDMDTM